MSQKSARTAGSSGATASTQARRRVLLTIRELDAVTEEASHLLAQARRRMRRVNQQIERGMSTLDVTYSTGMSDQRATLNAAMARIEKRRATSFTGRCFFWLRPTGTPRPRSPKHGAYPGSGFLAWSEGLTEKIVRRHETRLGS